MVYSVVVVYNHGVVLENAESIDLRAKKQTKFDTKFPTIKCVNHFIRKVSLF